MWSVYCADVRLYRDISWRVTKRGQDEVSQKCDAQPNKWNTERKKAAFHDVKPRCCAVHEESNTVCEDFASKLRIPTEANELVHAMVIWSDATAHHFAGSESVCYCSGAVTGGYPRFKTRPVLGKPGMPLVCTSLTGGAEETQNWDVRVRLVEKIQGRVRRPEHSQHWRRAQPRAMRPPGSPGCKEHKRGDRCGL